MQKSQAIENHIVLCIILAVKTNPRCTMVKSSLMGVRVLKLFFVGQNNLINYLFSDRKCLDKKLPCKIFCQFLLRNSDYKQPVKKKYRNVKMQNLHFNKFNILKFRYCENTTKFEKNLPPFFEIVTSKYSGIFFSNFYGLLRISELVQELYRVGLKTKILNFVTIYNCAWSALCNFKISQIIQSDDSRHSIIARLPLLDVFKSFCLHYLFTLYLSLYYLFFSLDTLFPSYKLQLDWKQNEMYFCHFVAQQCELQFCYSEEWCGVCFDYFYEPTYRV